MTRFPRSVVIHGHFYQPPREDPWLDEVEEQPSAAPDHDWNARIERECYRPVVAARIQDSEGRILRITNTLSRISYNFGPTLLDWMERAAPDTYAAVIDADRLSRERSGGHGNAMAMPYHHPILPLSSYRDKLTEVRWGIADFRRRYGRDPVGMWLPETAVDTETLDVLAGEGIRFTVLAPGQVRQVPAEGLPGRYVTSGGDEVAIFVYDGSLSHDIAFGPLTGDADLWAERMAAREAPGGDDVRLVALATDGETFGHHHSFGEMALAATLQKLDAREDIAVESFESFLDRHPPREEVEIVSPSAWSCAHGVDRWQDDCGCKSAPDRDTSQAWRRHLRDGLGAMADRLHAVFEAEGGELFHDPWAARDAFGTVRPAEPEEVRGFLAEHLREEPEPDRSRRALELLEMERNVLRSFTSCGWFFDDIGGLEAVQVLRYAARAIDLAGEPGAAEAEDALLRHLDQAESNDPHAGSGRDVFHNWARPVVPPFMRVAAGAAAVASTSPGADISLQGCETRVTDGRVELTVTRTGRVLEYETTIDRPSPARLGVTVRAEDGTSAHLDHWALTEAHAKTVRDALIVESALKFFGVSEGDPGRERDRGDRRTAVIEATERALGLAIERLPDDTSEEARRRVAELLDLQELLGLPIALDAQTAFYRSWTATGRSDDLAGLAARLGFAADGGGD